MGESDACVGPAVLENLVLDLDYSAGGTTMQTTTNLVHVSFNDVISV